MKFIFHCLVIYVAFSLATSVQLIDLTELNLDKIINGTETCLLIEAQKLDSNFQSKNETPKECNRYIFELAYFGFSWSIFEQAQERKLCRSGCVSRLDLNILRLVLEISVVQKSETLSENERKIQLKTHRTALEQALENIIQKCEAQSDRRKFFNIFGKVFGNNTETLEVLQYEYCLAKYVADENIFNLDMEHLNPNHIDTTYIDCNDIMQKKRNSNTISCEVHPFISVRELILAMEFLHSLNMGKSTMEKFVCFCLGSKMRRRCVQRYLD